MVERVNSSFTIREELKKTAEKAVHDCIFPGVSSLGGLIELALVQVLEEKGIKLEVVA